MRENTGVYESEESADHVARWNLDLISSIRTK